MARPYDLEEHRKSLRPQVSWCWGPQLKTPFWECSLLDISAGSSAPGRHEAREGRGEASGEEVVRYKPLAFAPAHSTLSHSTATELSLRLWLQVEPELGMKKCCHLVEISWNSNLSSSADWHLQFKRPVGPLIAALRTGPGIHCRNEFQTQLTFKKPISKVSFPHNF